MTYGPPCGIIGLVSDERMLSFADLQLPPLLKVWLAGKPGVHYLPPSRVIGSAIAQELRNYQKPHPFPGKVAFPPDHVSALITRLAEDGIEPFIPSILGAATETPWLAPRDYEALKKRILAAEAQYQEAATRWLVYDRMRQIANGLREDVIGLDRSKRSIADINAAWNAQLVTYMPLLCSLWGYMTRAIEADREPKYFPSDWRTVAKVHGPIELGGL